MHAYEFNTVSIHNTNCTTLVPGLWYGMKLHGHPLADLHCKQCSWLVAVNSWVRSRLRCLAVGGERPILAAGHRLRLLELLLSSTCPTQ